MRNAVFLHTGEVLLLYRTNAFLARSNRSRTSYGDIASFVSCGFLSRNSHLVQSRLRTFVQCLYCSPSHGRVVTAVI